MSKGTKLPRYRGKIQKGNVTIFFYTEDVNDAIHKSPPDTDFRFYFRPYKRKNSSGKIAECRYSNGDFILLFLNKKKLPEDKDKIKDILLKVERFGGLSNGKIKIFSLPGEIATVNVETLIDKPEEPKELEKLNEIQIAKDDTLSSTGVIILKQLRSVAIHVKSLMVGRANKEEVLQHIESSLNTLLLIIKSL